MPINDSRRVFVRKLLPGAVGLVIPVRAGESGIVQPVRLLAPIPYSDLPTGAGSWNTNGGLITIVGTSSGSLRLTDSTADATNKLGRVVGRPYTNSDADFLAFDVRGLVTTNALNYGGGSGILNAATDHHFFTAGSKTTLTGTERVAITNTLVTVSHPLTVSGLLTANAGLKVGTATIAGNVTANDVESSLGLQIGTGSNHNVSFFANGVTRALMTTAAFSPYAAVLLTLGTNTLPWGDLYVSAKVDFRSSGGGTALRLERVSGRQVGVVRQHGKRPCRVQVHGWPAPDRPGQRLAATRCRKPDQRWFCVGQRRRVRLRGWRRSGNRLVGHC